MTSAGILLYREGSAGLELLLAHPGGPFWRRKDRGAWSIPKGEVRPDETEETAARREFLEELGHAFEGELVDLGSATQRAGKIVRCFAASGDFDVDLIRSNLFEIEWPPRSGRIARFPEIDRVAWFGTVEARSKLNPAQGVFVDRLEARLARGAA